MSSSDRVRYVLLIAFIPFLDNTIIPHIILNIYSSYLIYAILGTLAEVIGDDEIEKLFKIRGHRYEDLFLNYATQYVDKCNIEYLKTAPEKRKDKLRNIAKRFVQQPDAYKNMKRDLEYSAKQYGCSFHELHDPKLKYPEEIEW